MDERTRDGAEIDGDEIVAMYREARAASAPDFKAWAMARSRRLLPLHSTHWVNGVMTERGAVLHDVATEGLRAGYWEHFQTLMPIDPVGPRMFAHPGRSWLIGYDDFPQRIRDEIMLAYGVRYSVLGMAADASTGIFSVVCWYRDPSMPPFEEHDRQLHERLLPHWVECLNLHRVTRALRDSATLAAPGSLMALVDATGLIHHAQIGFGELLAEEFPGWPGTSLPAPLLADLLGAEAFVGGRLDARWRTAPQQLWMVHARRRRATPQDALERAREAELQQLNASLAARELELAAARRALIDRERRDAALQERQRLVRDLHDGVGAHLTGLRSLLQPGATVDGAMADAVDLALDEMRLAVDAWQADDGDLAEVLAALRWRVQPRFDAAGVRLEWSMPERALTTPSTDGLPAGAVLQVQRVLMEALTNVLRHARAGAVRVAFEVHDAGRPGWQLEVLDDGIGWPAGGTPPAGVGLRSMAQRADRIGARLQQVPGLATASGCGAGLRLNWAPPPSG